MIFISAGHHKFAKGACFNDFCEHDEALIWQMIVMHNLQERDIACMAVPAGKLRSKTDFINSHCSGPSLAVEIHFNSAMSKGEHVGEGSETLYYPGSGKGKLCAEVFQDYLAGVFGPDRGAKEGYYRMDKRYGPDWFLKRTDCTAVIVEPEFIQHKDKIWKLRIAGCTAISRAITKIIDRGVL